MDERVLGLAGAALAIVLALGLAVVDPAHWAVELAVTPLNLEVSASVAGVDISLRF